MRLTQALTQISFATGAEAGARLTFSLGYSSGADTLLSIIRGGKQTEPNVPRVLGVDDWSFCKGKTFGTILVDLEQHKVIDLLPDRTAATFSAWLRAHPGVEVVCRDRSSDYTLAAKEAAPEAVQVADRWHLFKNLGDVLEAWLGRHRSYLTEEVIVGSTDENTTSRLAATWQLTPKQAEAHKTRRAERVAQFEKAAQMRKQGFSSEAIVSEVGISTRTLRRWSTLTTLPERKSRAAGAAFSTLISLISNGAGAKAVRSPRRCGANLPTRVSPVPQRWFRTTSSTCATRRQNPRQQMLSPRPNLSAICLGRLLCFSPVLKESLTK